MRRSLAKERYKLRLVERAMKDLPPLPTPLEVIAALERYDRVIAALAVTQLGRLHARLVVSQTRVRSDLDLGPAMRALAGRYLGIDLDYIGYVEHDDAVWLTVRRKTPLLIDSPASKGARNVERIARRVLALATAAREGRVSEARLPPPAENLTLYEALGVSRGASDEEIRRASKRQREIFGEGSLPLTSLVCGTRAGARASPHRGGARHAARPGTPPRLRSLDVSRGDSVRNGRRKTRGSRHGQRAHHAPVRARSRNPPRDTVHRALCSKRSASRRGSRSPTSPQRPRSQRTHLRAIEQDDFEELPALVYTRGFVQELAKCLRLDPSQVARTYLKRMREALALSGRTAS